MLLDLVVRGQQVIAYLIEDFGGHRRYQISSLQPDEFASSTNGYINDETRRILFRTKTGHWTLVPRPIADDIA